MLKVHTAPTTTEASLLKAQTRKRDEGNRVWLERAMKPESSQGGAILLIGGANLTHFRLRTAQSHVRRDLLPSFWSHVAIIQPDSNGKLFESSLEPANGNFGVPAWQGIQTGSVAAYDDPEKFPNIAVIQWEVKPGTLEQGTTFGDSLNAAIARLHMDRGTVDISAALWTWLGYAWGITDRPNPLLQGIGIPSAILVETVFSMNGIELTPGLASQSTCPEAIWQASKWWGDFYDSEATLTKGRPTGAFHLGQPAAAVTYEQASQAPGRTPRSKSSRQPK